MNSTLNVPIFAENGLQLFPPGPRISITKIWLRLLSTSQYVYGILTESTNAI